MQKDKNKHEDTTISLHPLSFEKAIETLAQSPKHKGSQVEESCNTKEDGPEPDSVKQ